MAAQHKHNFSALEAKWQKKWADEKVYSPQISEPKVQKFSKHSLPFYNLWMFPYPSAEGVHVGTIFSSTGSDVYGRFMRMNGYSVFQPMGYDSFGIHSENYAIKIGETPQKMLERAIAHYEKQFKSIGHGYDWTRTVTTSNKDYYKWTQWLFIQMFKAGLAYKKKAWVNWCPGCKTVLADEQIMTPAQAGKTPPGYTSLDEVPEGVRVCERCGNIPERKELSQWFFKITDYAELLLKNLDIIDWSERVKIAQKEWIGKKTGINITYSIEGTDATVTCFTTRPDTNFGATFIVVSPEYARDHLMDLIGNEREEVKKYIETSLSKTEQQRQEEGKVKTGVFTGLFAINQLNNYKLPIWISDFVLSGFGTGAVVGVPGHDKRDYEFATTFNIPVKRVVSVNGETDEITSIDKVQEEDGVMINSEFLNGLNIHDAKEKMMDYLEEKGWGEKVTTYHLRDWLISRQRYWGPPIPMIYCEKCAKEKKGFLNTDAAREHLQTSWPDDSLARIQDNIQSWDNYGWYPEENLPVELPEIEDYKPKGNGTGPLADHPEFYETTCPNCGGPAKRETDVSDTFLDSSWYFLRYPTVLAENSAEVAWDEKITQKWLPVDLYFGGAEHSVLHLMYARFITMVLYDLKLLPFQEPFPKFFAHGLMIKDGAKMSKSKGNIVNPDEYIEKYGADTLRLYLMFMGPMDGYPDFRDTGIEGMARFVNKVYALLTENSKLEISSGAKAKKLLIKTHKTIQKVTKDIKEYRYNTSLAALMELVNLMQEIKKEGKNGETEEWSFAVESLTKLLAPFAPHMSEEIWREVLGNSESVHLSKWPEYEESLTVDENIAIPVQVNGKLRTTLTLASEMAANKEYIESEAKKDERVLKWIGGKEYKLIFVPGKLVNFVL